VSARNPFEDRPAIGVALVRFGLSLLVLLVGVDQEGHQRAGQPGCRLDDVREPKIKEKNDAIVRLTASAICGTDLHMIRGTLAGMKPGTILGHEGVGVVEEIGADVRNLSVGDRVVIPSTIGCGYCSYCRAGYYSQCDNANPAGPDKGTAFFGGPADSGPFNGMQAEFVKLPDEVTDDQAILLSDIFPTAYFGAKLAQIKAGDTVCVLGCGPVGQFVITSAKLLGAGRVFAIDRSVCGIMYAEFGRPRKGTGVR